MHRMPKRPQVQEKQKAPFHWEAGGHDPIATCCRLPHERPTGRGGAERRRAGVRWGAWQRPWAVSVEAKHTRVLWSRAHLGCGQQSGPRASARRHTGERLQWPVHTGRLRLGKPAANFAARHGSVSEVHRHRERTRRETARAGGLGQEARGCGAGGQKGVCLGGWDAGRLERGGVSFPLGFGLPAGFPRAIRLTPISEALEVPGWPT